MRNVMQVENQGVKKFPDHAKFFSKSVVVFILSMSEADMA